MKLLVIGFNARPIAKSAKNAGYELGVIDYFGDMDLLNLTRNCFSVLRQKTGETLHRILYRSPAEYLTILAEIMVDEQGDFNGILIGSAFDKHPELVERLKKIGPILYANKPEQFIAVRDILQIQKIALNAGFSIPLTVIVNSKNELIEEAKNHSFPIVTRSGGGGGGSGIRLWNNWDELVKTMNNDEEGEEVKKYYIQEYISGIDASSSVICSKNKVNIISVNKQLIGDKNFNSPGNFSYCGNIVPLNYQNPKESTFSENLLQSIRNLFLKLDLRGSNGIDFVIKNQQCYFMEINPRIQGSIECIEYATGINIVKNHIAAFNNEELNIPNNPKYKRKAMKAILFSNSEVNISVKKYPKSEWIVDRTHIGVILENEDPFCSIVKPINNYEKDYLKIAKLAKKIMEINQ